LVRFRCGGGGVIGAVWFCFYWTKTAPIAHRYSCSRLWQTM